jgi:5,6,7,8-tetrahydromethanopterin hydro-lyase
MSDRIVLRIGEGLVAGGPPGTAAEPEVAIGELDGPFGSAFANLLGDQVKGHSRVLALLSPTSWCARRRCASARSP